MATKLPDLRLVNAYGATETSSPATLLRPEEAGKHIDSVGTALPCADIRVVDEEGRAVSPGVTGELWIAGPMVVPGYWRNEPADRESFTEGYWRSGDIGSVDADGYVRISDRIKDVINRAGYKIYSVEVENVVAAHPSVAECAVVGHPDPVLGERVHAFAVARGSVFDSEVLREFCRQQLSDYKVPETITWLNDALPRNTNGKVLKADLRRRLAGTARG